MDPSYEDMFNYFATQETAELRRAAKAWTDEYDASSPRDLARQLLAMADAVLERRA